MNEHQFGILLNEIKQIKRLVALSSLGDGTQTDQILKLSRLGFKTSETANILGTSPNTVRVILSRKKKVKK